MFLAIESKNFADFIPVDFGYENCEKSYSFGPNIRNYYLIHYIKSGCGTFHSPHGSFPVKAGQAFLICPDEICTYTADSENPWTYIWIGFRGNLSENFKKLSPVFSADGTIFEEALTAFSLDSCVEEFLVSIIFKLYCSLFSGKTSPNHVERAKGYINSFYMRIENVSEISKHLNIDRKYLARIFKAETGITLQQYLIDKRLFEAKKLLSIGYSVNDTAFMTGYRDSFNFSKSFKKNIGISPIKFKKEL